MHDQDLWRTVQGFTMVSEARCRTLCDLSRRLEAEQVTGDIVECGVCNGGSAAILAHFAAQSQVKRQLWLLDSFQGMPPVTPADGDLAKAYVGNVIGYEQKVREVLQLVGADLSSVQLIAGWFEETFPQVTTQQIALLHIDCDWYASVKLTLETLYSRVVSGGYVVIDDYGHWPGCRQAVHEFFGKSMPVLQVSDYTGRWFRKA